MGAPLYNLLFGTLPKPIQTMVGDRCGMMRYRTSTGYTAGHIIGIGNHSVVLQDKEPTDGYVLMGVRGFVPVLMTERNWLERRFPETIPFYEWYMPRRIKGDTYIKGRVSEPYSGAPLDIYTTEDSGVGTGDVTWCLSVHVVKTPDTYSNGVGWGVIYLP